MPVPPFEAWRYCHWPNDERSRELLYWHAEDMAAEAAHIARKHGFAPSLANRRRAARWAESAREAGPKEMLGAAASLYWLLFHDPHDRQHVIADLEQGFGLA